MWSFYSRTTAVPGEPLLGHMPAGTGRTPLPPAELSPAGFAQGHSEWVEDPGFQEPVFKPRLPRLRPGLHPVSRP